MRLKVGGAGLTVLLGALIAGAPLAMDIYLASMPSLTRALDATPAEVQLTLTVYMLGWGVAQLAVGPMADRFGRRPVMLAGLALFVAASGACALATTVQMLTAARFLQALGMAPAAVVPRAVVRDLYSGDRAAHMLSLMAVVLGIAPIVAPILGSHLHTWFGWRASFVFVILYGVVALACVAALLPETLHTRNRRATRIGVIAANFRRLLRSRAFVGYLLVASFATGGLFAFIAGSAFVFVSVLGQSEQGFGWLFGSVMAGNITGAIIGSTLVRRWGIERMVRRWSVLLLAAALAMGTLALARVDHPLAIVMPMFFYMVAFTTTMPQATAGALTPFPDVAGAAASLLAFVQFITGALAALVVGIAYDGTQRPMALVIAGAGVLAFVAGRLLLVRPRRPAA